MATTKLADLYDPEVWADLAHAEFEGKVVVAGGSGATIEADTLTGVPGSTIKFPSWGALTDLDDLTEGVAMTPEKLGQKNSEATVKEAGKAVEITDTADLNGLGNGQDEAIRQFGVLAARKVDADLITAALETVTNGITVPDGAQSDSAPLVFSTGAGLGLTWEGIVDGIEKFGDDFEPSEFAGLYIRSTQRSQVWKDEQFIKASDLGTGSVVRRGFLGEIAGVPVYVTDRLPNAEAALIKRGALGLLYKRRPIVEQDRDILARTNVVTTNLHYAVKRLNDKGVLKINVTA